jgi:hypothetical protein
MDATRTIKLSILAVHGQSGKMEVLLAGTGVGRDCGIGFGSLE